MNDEGQFKKRILLIAGKYPLKGLNTAQEVRDEIAAYLGDAIEVIEEAKKEFPLPPEEIPAYLEGTPCSPEGEYLTEIVKWFIEYFGNKR